jgi:hypothetical protein
MYKFTITLLLICLPFSLWSQENLIHIDKIVNNVYDEIVTAIGDKSRPAPALRMVASKNKVAAYLPGDKNRIEFEYAAYDICKSLGKDSLNAVAFILAHELGHYYRNHRSLSEAASAYASLDIGEKLAAAKISMDTTVRYETDADEFACFYSKIAGYSIEGSDEYLRAIYKGYSLPDNINRYPSLNDRCAISRKIQKETKELNKLFELANVLLLEEEYFTAGFLFKNILNKRFGSREIMNNLGVCLAMQGLQYAPEEWKELVYPFALDPKSRAGNDNRAISFYDSTRADSLFQLAENFFIDASALDKKYYIGLINVGILQAMSYKFKAAGRTFDQIEEDFEGNKDVLNQLQYARAILEFLAGDIRKLKELDDNGHELARLSLLRLKLNSNFTNQNQPLPSSEFALYLQTLISKKNYSENQSKKLKCNDEIVMFYERDTLGFDLMLINVIKPVKIIHQIIHSDSNTMKRFEILNSDQKLDAPLIIKHGKYSLEKRSFSISNMYTYRHGEQAESIYIVY